jgi:FG-GAP repeat protein
MIQSAGHGELLPSQYEPALGGWRLSVEDTIVPGKSGDFDGDGYNDFIIRSDQGNGWGSGSLGMMQTTTSSLRR